MSAAPSTLTPRPFVYEAIDRTGHLDEGEILATTEAQALERLRRAGVRPISVHPSKDSVLAREMRIPGLGPRVTSSELAIMARQFSTMIGAGIPLIRCLLVLQEQTTNTLLNKTLSDVHLAIVGGDSLSSALEHHPKVFDRLFVAMIRAGESAGALDTVLLQLANSLERSAAIRRQVRSAMSYPAAVLVMVFVIIVAMLIFVVPVFRGIYEDLGGTLPLPTRVLVGTSDLLTKRLPLVLLVVGLSVWGVRRWKASPEGEQHWDAMKLRLPLVGPLLHKTAMARLGRTLAVLTRSGVPVLEALRISGATTGNAVVSKGLADTMAGVEKGERLAENLGRHVVFPPMVVQLVAVGEETGALDEMFEIIGSTFETEVETTVTGLSALIEPLLMAFIGLVVGGMVIALYLPMFRIVDLVQ